MSDKKITVLATDLQTLLFATGAIKKIEHAVAAQADDPLIPPPGMLTEAHNRLSTEWRNQTRVNDDPIHNQPLTAEEFFVLTLLYKVNPLHGTHEIIDDKPSIDMLEQLFGISNLLALDHHLVSQLRRKGMLELGTYFQYIKWADTGEIEQTSQKNTQYRLSARGKMALKQLN